LRLFKWDIRATKLKRCTNISVEQSQTNNNIVKMGSEARVDNGFIKTSFLEATRRKEFQNKWMSSDTWAKLIAKYCITESTLIYNGTQLDKCLNSRQNSMLREQMGMKTNIAKDHVGIFRDTLRKHGSKVTYYYYATEQGHLPLKTESKWFENISDGKDLIEKVITRSTSNATTISLSSGLQQTKKRKLTSTEEVGLRSSEAPARENESPNCAILEVQLSSFDHHCPPNQSVRHPWSSYWDSPEAIRLFRVREGETTEEAINEQIGILTKANRTDDSYLQVIYGYEKMEDMNAVSSFEKHMIRIRSQLLCLALHLALDNMNNWTWNKCCCEAIVQSKRMGIVSVKYSKTIEKWYRAFREKRSFCIPLKKSTNYLPFLT
jgi:hypothetical protein